MCILYVDSKTRLITYTTTLQLFVYLNYMDIVTQGAFAISIHSQVFLKVT